MKPTFKKPCVAQQVQTRFDGPVPQQATVGQLASPQQKMADYHYATAPVQRIGVDSQTPFQSPTYNHTGLPTNLKTGMENLSGCNLDAVRVHYDSAKPATVEAHGYTQGTDIHLSTGQEQHLPHELGHVVQQMQGRVKATTTVGNMAVNDSPGLENEATTMGQRALQSPLATRPDGHVGAATVLGDVVQRKVGFEMEFAVPMSSDRGIDNQVLTGRTPSNTVKKELTCFLTGGPKYDNNRPITNGKHYKVVADKERDILWAYLELREDLTNKKLAKCYKKDDDISIPEYVTDPFDELATNSDATIHSTFDAIATSMQAVYNAGSQGKLNKMPGVGMSYYNYYVGVPEQAFLDYYKKNGNSIIKLQKILNKLKAAIQNSVAPQVTMGVMPSAIYEAHSNLLNKDFMTKDPDHSMIGGTNALTISLAYTDGIMGTIEHEPLFSPLKDGNAVAWNELKGIVTLIANYIVGETYYRSRAFEDYKVQKNAVPLMSKIYLATVLENAPGLNRLLTNQMIYRLMVVISTHKYFEGDPVYQALHKKPRVPEESGMLNDTHKYDMAKGVLGGTHVDHRGKRFDNADRMTRSVRKASDNQGGIPLEYRRIAARPSSTDLDNTLWPFVQEARALNMRHMTQKEQDDALWWTERSNYQVFQYYSGRTKV